MTRVKAVRVALGGLTLMGLAITVSNLAPRAAASPARDVIDHATSITIVRGESPDSLAWRAARHDPFRIARTAATVPYRVDPLPGAAPSGPPTARPGLALAGLLTGSDTAALIDGLPGSESTVVMRLGERRGQYVLRAVHGEVAVVAGPDTVWTLRVRGRP